MKLLLSAFAALLLAVAPNLARAADVATLGCVTDQLSPQTRDAFVRSARTLVAETVVPVAAEDRAALDTAIDTCRKRFEWSADATDAARYIVMSDFGLPELRAAVKAVGADPDAVAAAIAALAPDEIAGLATAKESSVEALLASFEKHNIALDTKERQSAVFALTVMIARRQSERARFAAN